MTYSNSNLYYLIIIGILYNSYMVAQCNSWEAHPQGIEYAKEQHVLYRDWLNNKQYQKAFPIWKALFLNVQSPKEAPNRHFKDGIYLYYNLAKIETNSTKKIVLIDTLINLYQQQENCLGKNTSNKVWMGYHLYVLQAEPSIVVEAFQEALQLGGHQTSSTVIFPMAQLSVYLYQKKHPTFTKKYVTALYHQLKDLVDQNKNNPIYLEKWKKAEQEFLRIQDYLSTIWDCNFFENHWRPLYLQDSNNIKQNEEILSILEKKCGQNTKFYQLVQQQQQALQTQNSLSCTLFVPISELPPYQQGMHYEMLSRKCLKNNDSLQYKTHRANAFALYEAAIVANDSTINSKEKAELAYRIAYEYFIHEAFPKAKKWCRIASVHQPKWGAPYILVGNLYINSYTTCKLSAPSTWEGNAVIWVALDEWRKAKKIDASVKEIANKRIQRYEKYLPSSEEVFQQTLQIGAPYFVDCWIQQKTTVQVAPN